MGVNVAPLVSGVINTKNNYNLKQTLLKPIKSNKIEFIEVLLKPDQNIIPKLQFGRPIEDLSPLLPREEFKRNMYIKTI